MVSPYIAFELTEPVADLFVESTLSLIAKEVKTITMKTLGTPYLVPNHRIREVLETIYSNFRPNTGDIATRYTINNENKYRYINYYADIIKQTVEVIVGDIRDFVGITRANNSYSVWNTLSGVNSRGLRSHSTIKVNERRANPLQFHLNF